MRSSFAIALFLAPLPCFGAACEDLAKLSLPKATITSALPGSDAICRVAATLTPTGDSEIKIEVWMPAAGWNGKYQAVGNGGWSGSINTNGMAAAVSHSYASSSTDTGHTGGSARFAMGHPEKLIDYAWRSEHEMTVAAKAIIAAFYGNPPRLSYWNGCSAGGKQGLMEAQRYPEDFDGIVAGSPAANWTGRAAQSIWVAQAVHQSPASFIPATKYPMLHRGVLAACDELDGVRDGILENPRACQFDPKVLACKEGDGFECLTPPQVEAARRIYASSVNPRTGKKLYPGLEPGSELQWQVWGGAQPLAIGTDYFKYVVFENPDWNFQTLDFDRDVERAEKLDARRINALDPDLRPFFARGGKLIQYHGWSDPQIAPGNSIDYFQSVVSRLGNVDQSYRLFMVPGMAHCGGGVGANSFDMMSVLEQWVEKKTAPDRVIASQVREGATVTTHPLCPFPQVAVYQGKGSTAESKNFVCK